MTDPQFSLVAALLDRSGSMQSIADDTRGGFDSFVSAQRESGDRVEVTLAQFDDEYRTVYTSVPVAQVPPLVLEPRGTTALLDAIGHLIADVGRGLAALPEDRRPGSVTVLVMTDGHENASVEYSRAAVRELIARHERDYAWDFVFLGANMDAVSVGTDLGFLPDKSMTYAATGDGVSAVFESVVSYHHRVKAAPASRKSMQGFTATERRRSNGGDGQGRDTV